MNRWLDVVFFGVAQLPPTLFCRILIIGGFKSSNERLNDLWEYSVVSRHWEERTHSNVHTKIQLSPRGGHSACCIGSKVWIYGGHGGAFYSRKDLDDLFVLDLDTWIWTKVDTIPYVFFYIYAKGYAKYAWKSRAVTWSAGFSFPKVSQVASQHCTKSYDELLHRAFYVVDHHRYHRKGEVLVGGQSTVP